MSKVLLSSAGKVLLGATGKLADKDCCCGDKCVGSLPEAGCAIQVCLTYKADVDEGSSGNIFELLSCGIWPDYTSNRWELDGVNISVFLPFVGEIVGVTHSIKVVWKVEDDDTVTNYMIVDGVESDHMNDPASLFDDGSGFQQFRIGSISPDTHTHREITDFTLATGDVANFPDGLVFVFPTDATTDCSQLDQIFYTISGSAVTVTGPTIRVDNDSGTSAYATFDYQPGGACVPHDLVPVRCCCEKYLALVEAVSTITLDFKITGLCSCGDIIQTKTWTRVPVETVPLDGKFRFSCTGNGRRLELDAGTPLGHGPGLDIAPFDFPYIGDSLLASVAIGVFSGPPDFTEPTCGWSVRPCTSSILNCFNPTPPDWDSTHTYDVGGSGNQIVFRDPAWNSGTTYAPGDRVTFSGLAYVSTESSNTNNQPDTSPAWWTRASYRVYVSIAHTNLNHSPPSSPAWWQIDNSGCSNTCDTDFCLDTTLLAIEDVPGVHVYSDTRTCSLGNFYVEWKVAFS